MTLQRPNRSTRFNRPLRLNRLSRVFAILLSPILIAQGRRLARELPRLPEAALPWSGTLEGTDPVRLLVLGDSTAAGVGAGTQEDALPGNLAKGIQARFGRGTHWRSVGTSGATGSKLLAEFIDEATSEEFDVVYLTVGANDALRLRPRRDFVSDVETLIARLRAASPNALILISLLPRFDRFTSLQNPMRWIAALHASNLDDGARQAIDGLPEVHALPKPPPYSPDFWASDRFHPSPTGYSQRINFALDSVPQDLVDRHLAR